METYGMETKNCPNCQTEFSRKPSELKRCRFCSKVCRLEYTQNSRRTECKYCGKVFYPEKRKNRKDPQFCSQTCMGSDCATLDYRISFLKQSIDFIDGFLLGDGHISKNNCHMSWSLKYHEFSEFMEKHLSAYCPKSSRGFIKDSRCKNGGFITTKGNSKCHPDFKIQRKRWYPNDKKIVPKDVSLSPESILIWYLGDGSATKYSVKLCTDDFPKNDVQFLIDKLKGVGIPSKMIFHCNKPRICMSSAESKLFFDYIGWSSPIKCYQYKFDSYAHRDRGYNTTERSMSKPQ